MRTFFNSLIFKIGVVIVIVESIVLFAIGFFYVNRFSIEIERRIERQVKIPGILMNRQLLKYESVGDKRVMTELVGEEFVDGFVVDTHAKVFYALSPSHIGKDLSEIPGFAGLPFDPDDTAVRLLKINDASGGYLVSITPLTAYEGAMPFFFAYVKVKTTVSGRARGRIARLFLTGSVICIVLTSGIIIWFTREVITRPVGALEESADRVAGGDLEHAIESRRRDELGSLARSFAGMQQAIRGQIEALETFNRNLEETVAHRTRDLEENMGRLTAEIVERKEAVKALGESEERLRILFDFAPDAYYLSDARGRIIEGNRAAESIFGYPRDELAGRHLAELNLIPPDGPGCLTPGGEVFRAAEPFEADILRKDGERVMAEVTTYPIMIKGEAVYLGIARDITERKKAHEFMIHSEKMLSVGGLAAGMAHEINNPLAGIMQNVQVLENRLSADLERNRRAAGACGITMEQIEAYMEERGLPHLIEHIHASVGRAAKIVDNMLSFSKKGETAFAPESLFLLIDLTVELAENDYDLKKGYDFRRIDIQREYAGDMPEVPCERAMIQQVIFNLLKNAAHAFAGKDGPPPKITLRVRPDGPYAVIEVADNGPGMEESVRKRVFEPFYTTKGVDVGTGLGLSVSYFIVTESHNGTMAVESAPGRGSCFIIRLPLTRPST